MQGQAEKLSKSRKKFLATTYKPFSRFLYSLSLIGMTMIVQTTWGNHLNATARGCVDIDPKCALIQDVVDQSQVRRLQQIIQRSAKRWALGCVNSLPAARGSREAGFHAT